MILTEGSPLTDALGGFSVGRGFLLMKCILTRPDGVVYARAPYASEVTYVDLRPDNVRPVQVLTKDGAWVTGDLEAYQRRAGVWEGYVRWSLGPADTYLGWFTEDRIRPTT